MLLSLKNLPNAELRKLHASGTCPNLCEFKGLAHGSIAGTSLIAKAGIWRGKVFFRGNGDEVFGYNRLGIGPWETRKFKFYARIGSSLFSDRDVVILDHDQKGNPSWVRAFHDELIQVAENQFLATSHQRVKGRLVFRSYFTLTF